jgi:glycosyltransferase involved in cell wall biosynthesis
MVIGHLHRPGHRSKPGEWRAGRGAIVNVAMLHYSAPPVVGGVESVLGHQARLSAGAGHQVRILAGRGEQVEANVPFVRIPLADSRHPDVLSAKAQLDQGQVPRGFTDLVEQLTGALSAELHGVDVLIAHNVCSLNKNLALTAALHQISDGYGSPRLVCWHHDLAWTTPRYRRELHPGFPWDLLRTAWPGVVQVAVSELRRAELSALLALPPEEIAVIPNGIDLARFFKLEMITRTFVQQLNLLDAEPLLLLPVRITPRKNIELAIRSLAEMKKLYPGAALVVTGPLGPHNPANVDYFARLIALRSELELQGAAHFLAESHPEFLPDEVIFDFYQLADALLMPSREEGFGIPLLEAGLARLPVFCANIPPLRALGGEQATYFSPDASPAEVAGLIVARLSADPAFALRVQTRKSYAWDQVYRTQIEPLLLQLGGQP